MSTVIDLNGRGAVVTGGARGIGFAIAQRFIASGASVSLWDMDAAAIDAAKQQLGAKAHGHVVDIVDDADVAKAVTATEKTLGKIDILVNNAGITGPNKTTWDYPVADWRRVIDVDLNGVFICCRAVVPGMIARGYGRVVNIASVAGKEGNPNAPAYSAAKAGVIGLTKSLGKELAAKNVIVNCVTPAAAKTDIFKQMTPEFIAYMKSKIPMNRFVEVDEIAALVAWLASEDCSFSTGGVFDISGGRATY